MALHCPATLHLARPGGDEQVRALVDSLREERVAAVVSAPDVRAGRCGALAASLLEVPHEVHAGLAAVPGADPGAEALGTVREALTDIADRYRGEHVLVLSHGSTMVCALVHLAARAPAGARTRRDVPRARAARLEVGDEGIAVLDWPGSAGPHD